MISELVPVFVDTIQADIEEGILYISEKYNVSIHLCACGCKGKTVLPFNKPNEWVMVNNEGKVSFTPSIGNFSGESPYHAHYYVTDNKIVWC
jgi:hypothetical protein